MPCPPAWSLPPPCNPIEWSRLPPFENTMPCEHSPVTIFPNAFTYIAINGEQVMTLGAVSLVAHTSGVLPIDRGGTNATTPEQARINLGLGSAATSDASAFATASQGALADTAMQPGDDAAGLGSDAAIPAGYALLADGAGDAGWGALPGPPVLDVTTTLYVELTGDDVAGDGTLAKPYRTIMRALASLNGITLAQTVTIQIGAGDFAESIEVSHPQGRKINIYGQPTVGTVTGVEEADFSNPLNPVPGVRGSNDLYNSAGMLPTDASTATRNAARSTDAVSNEALLRSIFPTRILPPSGTNGVYVTPDSAIGFFKDLLIIGGTVGITTHTTVYSISGQIALLNQSTVGLQMTRNCAVNGTAVVVVNCAIDGISIASDSSLDLANITIQGCGRYGLSQAGQGMVTARGCIATGCTNSGLFLSNARFILSSSVATKMHVTGCGSHGVVINSDSSLNTSISGDGPNTIKFCGNSLNQMRVLGQSSVYLVGSTAPVTFQSGLLSTISCINADHGGSAVIISPVVMKNGAFGVLADQAARVSLSMLEVSTPPTTDVIRATEGAYVGIETSISLPNGFGTSVFRAQKGGQIHDSGSTLQALAAANPEKFIGPFGQRQSDGSCIFGGALNTSSLSLLPTAVELAGQTASIKTGSTTPVEVITVAANGNTTIKGVVSTNNDFESTAVGKGVILRSPDGTRYRITVDDSGVVSATAAP